MRKLMLIATLVLSSAILLAACNKQEDQQPTQQQTKATKPTDPSDTKAWKTYLSQVVTDHMQGMTSTRPYIYYVPAGDSDEDVGLRQRQLDNVSTVVARTVLPGNMLALGGPDSSKTADMIISAFKPAKPGSFKGVIVLFVGDQADRDRVAQVVKPSGAEFRFVQM